MVTNHSLLTIGAFVLLSSILLSFNRSVAVTGDDISNAQDGILATTIMTSYMEIAQGLAFDAVTDTSDVALQSPSYLTPAGMLGSDGVAEDSVHRFNDFDDFSNFEIENTAGGTNRRYRTRFLVRYVNPNNVELVSGTQTFVKRMDLKTWRTFPPASAGTRLDTVNMALVLGYFHFD
jgi:hypothetical protein